MESTYTTKQGDVWDKIAYEVYGDEEYTGWLMENNFPLLDTFVFDAGVVLQTPAPPERIRQAERRTAWTLRCKTGIAGGRGHGSPSPVTPWPRRSGR